LEATAGAGESPEKTCIGYKFRYFYCTNLHWQLTLRVVAPTAPSYTTVLISS